MYPIIHDLLELFILALPVAAISWTVTHEALFSEFHDYCEKQSRKGRSAITRKFFYLFTCDYCFSHYVALLFLIITKFTLFFGDWRGYVISGFALVAIANVYMSLFARIRVDLRRERFAADLDEKENK